MITTHSDVVGSLLRPPELLRAREDLAADRIDPATFKAIEDRAVDEAIALQEEAGLEIVTDGEMRRLSFQSQMTEAVDGFGEVGLDAFLWGDWHGEGPAKDFLLERPANLAAVGRLRRKRPLAAEEFTYLRSRASRTPKITLPSPSLFASFWSKESCGAVYPTLDCFLEDLVEILVQEIAELVRLGATYIQLDAPHYPLLLDPVMRAYYEGRGWTVERWLSRGIELDNTVMSGFPEVTFGFHL